MSTLTLSRTDERRLVAEVEAFLASQPAPQVAAAVRPLTAHPLVSLTTDQLVEQALGTTPAAQAPSLSAPPRLARFLPERLWRLVGAARPRRDVTVPQYLGLVVMVLEQHGWTGAGARRTVGGCRCIAGAQELLANLGYGDERTASEASRAIQGALHRRGVTTPYWSWNDAPRRTRSEVLGLLREAGA